MRSVNHSASVLLTGPSTPDHEEGRHPDAKPKALLQVEEEARLGRRLLLALRLKVFLLHGWGPWRGWRRNGRRSRHEWRGRWRLPAHDTVLRPDELGLRRRDVRRAGHWTERRGFSGGLGRSRRGGRAVAGCLHDGCGGCVWHRLGHLYDAVYSHDVKVTGTVIAFVIEKIVQYFHTYYYSYTLERFESLKSSYPFILFRNHSGPQEASF